MIASTVTIQLYPAEGRQWATVTVEGSDDPRLVLAEAIKALGAEISRVYFENTPGGVPLNLGSLEAMPTPVSI